MPHVKFSSPALPSVYFRLTRLSKGEQLFWTATLEGKASWRRWDTTTCTSRDSSEHFWTVRPWRLRVVAIGYTHKKWWKSREKAGGMTPLFEKCFSFFSDAVRRSDEHFRKSWPTPPQTLTILLLICILQVPQVESNGLLTTQDCTRVHAAYGGMQGMNWGVSEPEESSCCKGWSRVCRCSNHRWPIANGFDNADISGEQRARECVGLSEEFGDQPCCYSKDAWKNFTRLNTNLPVYSQQFHVHYTVFCTNGSISFS